jgi:diguanylate cyclase (GGDEF)-like protein
MVMFEQRRRRGEEVPDLLIRWFRWACALVAAGVLVANRAADVGSDLPPAILLLGLTLSNALDLVWWRLPRLRPTVRRTQVAVDTALAAAVAAAGGILAGPDVGPLWVLLLLPIIEAAVRFGLRGAVVTTVAGVAGTWLLAGASAAIATIESQVVVLGAALAVALVSGVSEGRLVALSRAHRESDHRASLLATVVAAAQRVTALDPQRVLEAVTEAALELGFDMAEICVLTDGGDTIAPVVQRGWPDHHPPASQPVDAGVAGQAVQTGSLVVVEDYQRWEHALPIHRTTGIARSAASAPIFEADRIVAVLTVANSTPRVLTDYERDCLALLASQGGVALQNATAYVEGQLRRAELEHRATIDPMTRLHNREHVLRVLARRFAGEGTGRERVTVLFVDLDDFKLVNDTFGHAAGDEVIVEVAQRLRDALRPEDVVGRIGGDEFLVILDHTPEQVSAIADRVLDAVRQPVAVGDDTVRPGVSIGAATHRPGESTGDLIARADAAMYRAKDDEHGSFAHA